MSAVVVVVLVSAAWAAMGRATYWLLRDDWTRTLDWTLEQHRIGLAISALGPIGLLVAVLIWLQDRPQDGVASKDIIIEPRKKRL